MMNPLVSPLDFSAVCDMSSACVQLAPHADAIVEIIVGAVIAALVGAVIATTLTTIGKPRSATLEKSVSTQE